MILPVETIGPTYVGQVDSRDSLGRLMFICLEENLMVEKVLMINPAINDLTLEVLNRLALAEISPIIIMNPWIDSNPYNAQARSVFDISEKIKKILPNNSFVYRNKELEEIDLPIIVDLGEYWRAGRTLILLPGDFKSFFFFLSMVNLNGVDNFDGTVGEKQEIINLPKVYGEISSQEAP